MEQAKGIVKWFNAAKGFGFITGQSGEAIFVSCSAIQESAKWVPQGGEHVVYSVVEGPKGIHAESVIKVVPPAKSQTWTGKI